MEKFDLTKENKENNKKSSSLYLKNKYNALLFSTLMLGSWVVWYELWSLEKQEKQEKEKSKTEIADSFKSAKNNLEYRDNNPDFFKKNLKPTLEILEPWVEIVHDAWISFYKLTEKDIIQEEYEETKTIKTWTGKNKKKKEIKIKKTRDIIDFEGIRLNLAKYPKYAYLSIDEYARHKILIDKNGNETKILNKVKSFNVNSVDAISQIKKNKEFLVPIPLDYKVRQLSTIEFANYCKQAIEEMKTDPRYWKRMLEWLWLTTEEELVACMVAFARSETTWEFSNFSQQIWRLELHRREEKYKAYSFSVFHILMEENKDWSPWPWLEARWYLWLTEWQIYHPKNAAKLFLWYWMEKTWNTGKFFPLNKDTFEKTAKKYNWSKQYAPKLRANYQYATKVLNNEIIEFDNSQLENTWFEYVWIDREWNYIYKYIITKDESIEKIKEELKEKFNQNKDTLCPSVSEDDMKEKKTKDIIKSNQWNDTIYLKIKR